MISTLQKYFTFQILQLKKLNGYTKANYLLTTVEGKYIFKTYEYTEETWDQVIAENEVLFFLQEKEEVSKYPLPVAFANQKFMIKFEHEGIELMGRLLTFLEGEFLAEINHTAALFHSWGEFLAKMDYRLMGFRQYKIQSRVTPWDLQHITLNNKNISAIPDPSNRKIVCYFIQQFEEHVTPKLHSLRKSIVQNDPNEWNVLATDGQVSGVIDFGDTAYTPTINSLAIAIAYAIYDKSEPLHWAVYLLKAYHNELPLTEDELSILYYLIAGRLCTSVIQSAYAAKLNPGNPYISVSEKNAWNMLHQWITINPKKAQDVFFQAVSFPISAPSNRAEVIKRRHQVMHPIVSLSYDKPIYMERSAFQYMYDREGNTFLDAYNNIPHVGHAHPSVVSAGQRQMAKLNTNTRYLYDQLADYSEKLLAKFPDILNKVYFVNSGSAASDLAIRMAQAHTHKEKIMVMEHGYHGNTQLSIDISDYKFSNKKGQGQKDYIIKTPIPDTYHGEFTKNDGTAGKQYAKQVIQRIREAQETIAGFISEPIVGCGGQVPLAKGYLKEVYPAIREAGGMCISDEVQTGFGRLGDYFWGFQMQEVIPDIVILGKPMANGHPMGAVVTTSDIADSFGKGVEFFSSFGGNPVSCAIGSAVLEVIETEGLQLNAKMVGNYYQDLFLKLQKQFPQIGDIRGSGLFIGIEIVHEDTKEPFPKLAKKIKNKLRSQHILISTDGPFDSVLKTKPPLCFTKENAEQVVESIARVISQNNLS